MAVSDFAFNMDTRAKLSQLRVLMKLPTEGQVIEELVRRSLPSPNGHATYETICSGCGLPFRSSRRPLPNKRHWCANCRASGEPAAQRARDFRDRKSKVV